MLTLAQIPVSSSIKENLETVKRALRRVQDGTIVVFPEGALSGYSPENKHFIANLNFDKLQESHTYCDNIAKERNIVIVIGSVEKKDENFYNTAYIFSPDGIQTYRKVNLAFYDKKHFTAGSELPVFKLQGIKVGILMCREIMYPEQWRILAIKGAQVLIHLNNATGPEKYELWRSYLISRAGENQRYVISVNCVSREQGCPTMVVNPKGRPIIELNSNVLILKKVALDLREVNDYYLNQRRTDIVDIVDKS